MTWAIQYINGSGTGKPDNNQAKDITLYGKIRLRDWISITGCASQGQQPDDKRLTAWLVASIIQQPFTGEGGLITQKTDIARRVFI